jgi:TnpA family transposase
MPGQFLSAAERERLEHFPQEIAERDLNTFFTLSAADIAELPSHSAPPHRLGFALQLCALRYLGFSPLDLTTAPAGAVAYIADQLDLDPALLARYGLRAHTRTDHFQHILAYLGFRKAGPGDLRRLEAWLVERALEHDRPTLLLQLACERLRREQLVRPGITSLERLVVTARTSARQETVRRLSAVLTPERKKLLDALLVSEESHRPSRLAWLQRAAMSNSPKAIVGVLEKVATLKAWEVDRWDISVLTPNRQKFLAQLARKSTTQALQRMPADRRYPILLAFVSQALSDLTDEAIDMFDHCLADTYARAGHDLETFRATVARTTNEQLHLFGTLAQLVLDPTIRDARLRTTIYQTIPPETLRHAVEENAKIVRPLDDSYFDFVATRYSYLRQFAPAFLDAFAFQSNVTRDPLLAAITVLRELNATQRRVIPAGASVGFVPDKWQPYVIGRDGHIDRHYYELCVLWELRNALRAGNIWLGFSRRYANPETYLIPTNRWPALRPEVCQQLQLPPDSTTRITEREHELSTLLDRVDPLLAQQGKARMQEGKLVVSPLEAEERPESAAELERQIDKRLPLVDLSELLVEVDSWTHFTASFVHASGRQARRPELQPHFYAALMAQGCNLGLTRMAQNASLTYRQLAWTNTWYLREETLKAATTTLVNFHYHQPLSQYWGGGTLSSSDGQRFPVSGKVRNATALPRYFGYGRGVTFYTWTSDQFSQYGTKVIPATVRDATYVLDEILDNETELSLVEHTTDTAGYTDIIFALFDLLGMQFSPRLRDIGSRQLYRLDRASAYPNLRPLLKGKIKQPLIRSRWEDMVRVAGSLKLGWVTTSLFISKLQAYPRRNALALALQEYGRLIKTIFILRYLEDEAYRRRINTQLNKGEALHMLREFLFFANKGTIRRKQEEEQTNQAECLNLLTNAVVAWNTVYMTAAIEQLRAEGYPVREEDIVHLSPARFEHLNPYGKYLFDLTHLPHKGLRPLRQPGR